MTTIDTPPPLAEGHTVRIIALDLLDSVLGRRQPLDEALAAHKDLAKLEPRDRAFARLLAATVLRRLGQIDDLIGRCLEHPLRGPARRAHHILRLGAAQLLFLGTPAHAAVDTSVRLAEALGALRFRALINAVLRRLARDGAAWRDAQDAARLNTPGWLWESWVAAYGEETTRAIAASHVAEPPLDLTPHPKAPADLAARLDATLLPTGSLRRRGGGAVDGLPGFAEGLWWVQDSAAALPARLLGAVAGRPVLDLCAAPGGKTAQLAAAGGHVTAVDRSAKRLDRVRANLERLGLEAETITADAAVWRPKTPVSHILLDAPCTATGTLRRHPDIARLKTPEDVAKLAKAQSRLLDHALDMLAPGGLLVFTTCSLQPEEGPALVARLLDRRKDCARVPIAAGEIGGLSTLISPDGDLRTLPAHCAESGGMDGFFAARLKRLGEAAT